MEYGILKSKFLHLLVKVISAVVFLPADGPDTGVSLWLCASCLFL